MTVYEFVAARRSTRAERAAMARDMYKRFFADMEAKGYSPQPIEEFLFMDGCTQYFWTVGTIVRMKSANDGKAYLVKGYDHVNGLVNLSQGAKADADDLEPADIPEDILDVARQQLEAKMAENCPLKEMACLA